jgi:hypothetical protein
MAKLTKLRSAQTVLSAVFPFVAADTMVNTSGTETSFGVSGTNKYDIITMPPNSVVVGGRVIVKTIAAGGTSTIDIGDSDDEDRYTETGAVDLADADAPASGFEMLGDGKQYTGNQAIRITIANGATITATDAVVVVNYVVVGRASENVKTT